MKCTCLLSCLLHLFSQWYMRIAALKVTLCGSLQASWQYELFAVVAHSGSTSCGHYCAYIRSLTERKWYCFNDSEVCQVRRQVYVSFASGTLLQISFSLTDWWLKRTRKEIWSCRALCISFLCYSIIWAEGKAALASVPNKASVLVCDLQKKLFTVYPALCSLDLFNVCVQKRQRNFKFFQGQKMLQYLKGAKKTF